MAGATEEGDIPMALRRPQTERDCSWGQTSGHCPQAQVEMTGAEVRAVAVRVTAEAEERGPGRGEAGGSSLSPPPEHTRQEVSGMGAEGTSASPRLLAGSSGPFSPFCYSPRRRGLRAAPPWPELPGGQLQASGPAAADGGGIRAPVAGLRTEASPGAAHGPRGKLVPPARAGDAGH